MKSNTLSWNAQKTAELLTGDKVILAPSDTVWGLCGRVSQEVFEEMNKLKVRNEKPYLVLASSLSNVKKYAQLPDNPVFSLFLQQIWPGPVTVLCKALSVAPSYMVSKEGTIAFRIPAHPGLQTLLQIEPLLFSTSANISGNPVPEQFQDIDPVLKAQVAGCISDGSDNDKQGVVPSTIISVVDQELQLVREGKIPFSYLEKVFDSYKGKKTEESCS